MKLEDYYITLGDIFNILKRNRKYIVLASLILSFLALSYVLMRPTVYEASAHFKELGKNEGGGGHSITKMLLGGSGKNMGSQAVSAMKSRSLLREVAMDLGLQGSLVERGHSPRLYHHVQDQLKVAWAHYKRREIVGTHCPRCDLMITDIEYKGQTTVPLTIEFLSKDTYLVKTAFGGVGEGRLGFPFRTDHFAFTLNGGEDHESKCYSMALVPIEKVVDHLEGAVNVELDEDDSTLVLLEYSHPNQQRARGVLNGLMRVYQSYLKKEQDRFADIQLEYLKRRQEEMFSSQAKVMRKHAQILSQDLSTSGFVNFEKEMEFLFKNRLACLEKINTLGLKLQRLQTLLRDPQAREGQIFTHEELTPVKPILEELTKLKMQRDSLSLALTHSQSPSNNNLDDEIITLNRVTQNLDELAILVKRIKKGRKIDESVALVQHPNYQVGEWVQKLQDQHHTSSEKRYQKQACLAYLANLQRLFEMQQRIIQERLTYQCQEQPEFQGIDLVTATQLQLGYLKEAHQFDAMQKEAEFILQQLQDSDFEINSLSATLSDPISQEIIRKSSSLALQLRDQKYHSPKEQERTREELDTQKRFLRAHLTQTLGVQTLHNDLLQDRIRSLQGMMLELIHEKISVLEKHINDFIGAQAISLAQQKELIIDTMNEINQNMATLPEKWMSEQLIKQNVDLNKAIVEELTRLVENKNISHNLELIQSAPLDQAWTASLPKKPRLILIAVIGAFFGAFFSGTYFVLRQLISGVEATPDNLKSFNQSVLGTFDKEFQDPPSDNDLEILRRLSCWMDEHTGKVLLTVGSFYASSLAQLLAKKGKKVLILNSPSSQPGLLQYLDGSSPSPQIQHGQEYDSLVSGGVSRYMPELVHSSKCTELLTELRQRYDWIICFSDASPCSSDVQALMSISDLLAVTLGHESLPDVIDYFESSKPVVFMFSA